MVKNYSSWLPGKNWPVFILFTIILLFILHALAFFPHEYGHSFTAWILGWKENPLALNYGHLSVGNLLVQLDIDENVNYSPIFAGGLGYQAAIIAAAGVVIGNVIITYPISRLGFYKAKERNAKSWGLFFYWFCLASVGNFIDYVPIRTFAHDSDMFTVEKGFGCSPWWVIVVLGIPFTILLFQFFLRFVPAALHWLFPDSTGRRMVMIILTTFIMFGFYGSAGWSEADAVSHTMSVISVCVLVPAMIIFNWWYTEKYWVRKKAIANS